METCSGDLVGEEELEGEHSGMAVDASQIISPMLLNSQPPIAPQPTSATIAAAARRLES